MVLLKLVISEAFDADFTSTLDRLILRKQYSTVNEQGVINIVPETPEILDLILMVDVDFDTLGQPVGVDGQWWV